jgi:cyclic pyranopterin phosphate synthase
MAVIEPFTGISDRSPLAQKLPLATPYTLNIFPSNACNFRCNYCVQSLTPELLARKYAFKREIMSLEVFGKIVQQAGRFPGKLRLMSFLGQGEPMVNPSLSAMIRHAKESEVAGRVDIVTNASLLTREKSDELIDSGLDVLRVSVQGMDSEKFRSVAQVDLDFDEFMSNVSYFFEKSRDRCKVYVKIMDSCLGKGQDKLFYEIFDKISDRMFIEQIKPVYDGVDYGRFEILSTTDRRGVEHERRLVCPQPFYSMSIWPNGDVIPCSAIHKVNCLGNVNTSNLVEMWKSKSLRDFRIFQLRKLRSGHPQCGVCCAPDDCAHPEDVLDNDATRLAELYQKSDGR